MIAIDANKAADAVIASASPAGTILLHEGRGEVLETHRQSGSQLSADAAERVIKTVKEQGYRFETGGELLTMANQARR